jgi:dihydroorotase-like cyclic amidohydrolase
VPTTLVRRARLMPDGPPQGVLVAGGIVAAVGPIGDTAGAAEIIDLEGRFVLPIETAMCVSANGSGPRLVRMC